MEDRGMNISESLPTRQYFRYDDQKYQIVRYKGKHILESKIVSKTELRKMKAYGEKYQELKVSNMIQKKKDASDIIRINWQIARATKTGLSALESLIDDYALGGNAQEVLRLVSLLLMGYTAKMLIKFEGSWLLQCSRAPVVCVTQHKDDLCGGFEHLAHLVECFAVNTNVNDQLIHHNPTVLPDSYLATKIDECAYITLHGRIKDYRFPAIYRHTAVLIHSGFFSAQDIKKFVHRNVWATAVVFRKKLVDKLDSACIRLNLNKMNLSNKDWDDWRTAAKKRNILDLIEAFVAWLALLKQDKDLLNDAVSRWVSEGMRVIQKYCFAMTGANKPVLRGSEKQYACFQIATLRAFMEFCEDLDLADISHLESLWNTWCNALFPGSRDEAIYEEQEQTKLQKEKKEKIAKFDAYEELLNKFIMSASDGMIAARDSVDWANFTPTVHYTERPCIFLDIMHPRKNKSKDFVAVKIMKTDLLAFGEMHGNEYTDVISYMWSKKRKKEELREYIHSIDNGAVVPGETNVQCVVLVLEKMNFLGSDVIEKLRLIIQ